MNFYQKIFKSTEVINTLSKSECNLIKKIEVLQVKNDYLNSELKKYTDPENWQSFVEIDFKKMNVMSIERTYDFQCHMPKTVLGYMIDQEKKKLSEWCLYISEEEHLRLINEFKEYKSKN